MISSNNLDFHKGGCSSGVTGHSLPPRFWRQHSYWPCLPVEKLTSREKEIVRLIAHDMSDEDICTQLDLSPGILKLHRSNILRKLGVRGNAGIVRFAIQEGLLGGEAGEDEKK